MATTQMGMTIVVGAHEPRPIEGLPPGRVRLRFSARAARIFVRPPEGGIREFVIEDDHGKWKCGPEIRANREAVKT